MTLVRKEAAKENVIGQLRRKKEKKEKKKEERKEERRKGRKKTKAFSSAAVIAESREKGG